MLYLFDVDGTLIRSFMREGARDHYDAIEVLPGAREKLDELRAAGNDVALVTNQGGIAFGYQTSEQINRKIYGVLAELGFPPDRVADRLKGNAYVAASRPNEFCAAKPPCAYVPLHHPQAKDPKW